MLTRSYSVQDALPRVQCLWDRTAVRNFLQTWAGQSLRGDKEAGQVSEWQKYTRRKLIINLATNHQRIKVEIAVSDRPVTIAEGRSLY